MLVVSFAVPSIIIDVQVLTGLSRWGVPNVVAHETQFDLLISL
jgi:hypothetical protein